MARSSREADRRAQAWNSVHAASGASNKLFDIAKRDPKQRNYEFGLAMKLWNCLATVLRDPNRADGGQPELPEGYRRDSPDATMENCGVAKL